VVKMTFFLGCQFRQLSGRHGAHTLTQSFLVFPLRLVREHQPDESLALGAESIRRPLLGIAARRQGEVNKFTAERAPGRSDNRSASAACECRPCFVTALRIRSIPASVFGPVLSPP
jgi:hypothetical protein